MINHKETNDKKFDVGTILIFIMIIPIICLAIYNFYNNPEFLKINISSILTLVIAIIFAYFLNQQKSDERKKKDQIERILEKIQSMLSENIVINIQTSDDLKYNMMFQRALDNRINILMGLNTNLVNESMLKYIYDHFEEYKNIIGDNHGNFEKLKDSEQRMNRIIGNIDYKLDELILNLYKK